jgi:hypothetical protein
VTVMLEVVTVNPGVVVDGPIVEEVTGRVVTVVTVTGAAVVTVSPVGTAAGPIVVGVPVVVEVPVSVDMVVLELPVCTPSCLSEAFGLRTWTGARNTMMHTTATRQAPATPSSLRLRSMAPSMRERKRPLRRK